MNQAMNAVTSMRSTKPWSEKPEIWMDGGGVQSAAIAALIVQRKYPVPDYALIVDTEREQSTTWIYLDTVIRPALLTVGVEIVRIKKSEFATVDVYGGKEGKTLLLPAFTNLHGNVGKLSTFCSNEWKLRVAERWERKNGIKKSVKWLGISCDEKNRIQSGVDIRYPLIEMRMNRGDCIKLVKDMGWPPAPRSSCYMCPNHLAAEWRDIRDNKPEDWKAAILFEQEMQQKDKNAFLHHDCVPLAEADLDERNGVLFGHCDSGLCFV